jgi:hypothetical protein
LLRSNQLDAAEKKVSRLIDLLPYTEKALVFQGRCLLYEICRDKAKASLSKGDMRRSYNEMRKAYELLKELHRIEPPSLDFNDRRSLAHWRHFWDDAAFTRDWFHTAYTIGPYWGCLIFAVAFIIFILPCFVPFQ